MGGKKQQNSNTLVKNRLRYLLAPERGFATWETSQGERVCGFDAWSGNRVDGLEKSPKLRELCANPESWMRRAFPNQDANTIGPAELVAEIFNAVGHPISFESLAQALARLWNVKEISMQSLDKPSRGDTDREGDPKHAVEGRMQLEGLWGGMGELSPVQRAALLLSLQDSQGRGVVALLPIVGIAGLSDIARVIAMTDKELTAIWNELPLEDTAIAGLLGVTPPDVINLRQAARRRLMRRTEPVELV